MDKNTKLLNKPYIYFNLPGDILENKIVEY